jgi:hypothetical protein
MDVSSNPILGTESAILGFKFGSALIRVRNFSFGPYARGTFNVSRTDPALLVLRTSIVLNSDPNATTIFLEV